MAGPNEIKEAISEIDVAFNEFKAGNNDKLSDMRADIDELAKKAGRHGGSSEAPSLSMTSEEKSAFSNFIRKGDATGIASLQTRSNQVGIDADGGYAVPETIGQNIEKMVEQLSPLRQIANVQQVGPDHKQLVAVGGTAAGWVGETTARPETGSPKLAEVPIVLGEIYANPAATQKILDDAYFNAEEWIISEVADQFSKYESSAFITGDGVNKPKGLLDYPTSTDDDDTRAFGTLMEVATGAGATITADSLINVIYSLRPEYRRNAHWLMNAETLALVRKLKDADGNYLWRPGLTDGQPDRLLGFPIVEDESMPGIAADSFPIIFGDFRRGYMIGDRLETRLLRDPLTNKPYVHFYTVKRVGGAVINSNALRVMKVAA